MTSATLPDTSSCSLALDSLKAEVEAQQDRFTRTGEWTLVLYLHSENLFLASGYRFTEYEAMKLSANWPKSERYSVIPMEDKLARRYTYELDEEIEDYLDQTVFSIDPETLDVRLVRDGIASFEVGMWSSGWRNHPGVDTTLLFLPTEASNLC
ncbi:MAG: hypothetical protein AAF394_10345 [Planctomycetota bacterium]